MYSIFGPTNLFEPIPHAADLLRHCVFHGLRKAALTRLADAGCTVHELAAISGHKIPAKKHHPDKGGSTQQMDALLRKIAKDD